MAETIQVNFRLLPETVEHIEQLCRETFRSKGDLIDWAIARAWEGRALQSSPAQSTTPAEAGEQITKAMNLAAHAAIIQRMQEK